MSRKNSHYPAIYQVHIHLFSCVSELCSLSFFYHEASGWRYQSSDYDILALLPEIWPSEIFSFNIAIKLQINKMPVNKTKKTANDEQNETLKYRNQWLLKMLDTLEVFTYLPIDGSFLCDNSPPSLHQF